MARDPSGKPATAKETAIFFAKLAAYLLGLLAFGTVIFLIRRSLNR